MMRRMFGIGFLQIQKVATVSQRLDEQKDRVKQQRHRHEKDFLFRGKRWALVEVVKFGETKPSTVSPMITLR